MITILYVHQGSELYGSDKVLLNIVKGLDRKRFKPIIVLPEDGPLVEELTKAGIEIHFAPVVKISRKIFGPIGLLTLPFSIVGAIRKIDRVLKGRRIDMVHSNTLAVLAGAVWARLRNVKHLWHVHEIIRSPMSARKGFPLLIRLLADQAVCNSVATGNWLTSEQPALANKTLVVWNGIEAISPPDSLAVRNFRDSLKISADDLLVTLVGRISLWKGQKLFVDAARMIREKGHQNVRCLIVGGVFPGQEHIKKELEEHIDESGGAQYVKIVDFTNDIDVVWQATDLAVVPSTEPEPFGMVAIEAMRAGKPVIASNHGGLQEIVEHGKTGILFPPGDAVAFAGALIDLITKPDKRRTMGEAGKKRQEELFSVEAQVNQISKCYPKEIDS
ncbi:MAG: glycosyltransferase family 4 protein [Desulfobulbaceae bacterium]|nr:glycosyltransferase family 4 protein [Desulfobulbaceae bacterium]